MTEGADKMIIRLQALQQSDAIPDRIGRHAAALALAAMQERIHIHGQAADGTDIGSYSSKPIYVNPAKTLTPATFIPLGKWGKGTFTSTGQLHRTRYFDGGYQDFRQTAGLPADRVNLVLTGALRDSLTLVKTGKEYLPGWASAGFALQAQAIERKYGKAIWSWSEKERELMEQTSRDLLTSYLETGTPPDTADGDTGIGHLHSSYGDTAGTERNWPPMKVIAMDRTGTKKPVKGFFMLKDKPRRVSVPKNNTSIIVSGNKNTHTINGATGPVGPNRHDVTGRDGAIGPVGPGNPIYAYPNLDQFSNAMAVLDMTKNWMKGSNKSYVFVNNSVANAMRSSPYVSKARDFFYNKYKWCTDLDGASVTNYDAKFGLSGLLDAGLDPVKQFVGNYKVDIFTAGDQLIFEVKNVTSFQSLTYDKGPDWEGGAMGNMRNIYVFTEPILYDRLK